MKSCVDNTAVSGSANKLFTTSKPLKKNIHLLRELHLANLRLDLEWIATENSMTDRISRDCLHFADLNHKECSVVLSALVSVLRKEKLSEQNKV